MRLVVVQDPNLVLWRWFVAALYGLGTLLHLQYMTVTLSCHCVILWRIWTQVLGSCFSCWPACRMTVTHVLMTTRVLWVASVTSTDCWHRVIGLIDLCGAVVHPCMHWCLSHSACEGLVFCLLGPVANRRALKPSSWSCAWFSTGLPPCADHALCMNNACCGLWSVLHWNTTHMFPHMHVIQPSFTYTAYDGESGALPLVGFCVFLWGSRVLMLTVVYGCVSNTAVQYICFTMHMLSHVGVTTCQKHACLCQAALR